MKIITNEINHSLKIEQYMGSNNSCFLDIETTGLNRNTKAIYLVGVLYFDLKLNSWVLNQYFATNKEKESKLLKILLKDISSFEKIITYNGDNFDIPFINHRLKYHNIKQFINKEKSFDLYTIIRNNKDFLDLENLKLKTIEKSLGFHREDIYSGFDCIGFYYEYLKTRDLTLREKILKHNYDDLVHMLDILQILDVIEDKKSIYWDFNNSSKRFIIENISFSKDILKISGYTNTPLQKNIKYFSNEYSVTSKDLIWINISVDIKYGYVSKDEKCAYIDTFNYTNLEPKSLTKYNIPSNIFILMVEKKYYMNNIKNLLKSILVEIIETEIIY